MNLIHTHKKHFISKSGKNLPTDSCFVNRLHSPMGGWKATITVNGITQTFSGRSGQEVFNIIQKHFIDNNIDFNNYDLWFTLNYQWAEKSQDNRLIVSRDLILSSKVDHKEKEPPYFHPEVWGSIQWKSLGLFLSLPEKEFSYEKFLAQLEHTLLLLNNVRVPHLGCIMCYTEFSPEVAMMRQKNLTREQCRRWLYDFHNSVNLRLGKPILTYEQAAQENLWI